MMSQVPVSSYYNFSFLFYMQLSPAGVTCDATVFTLYSFITGDNKLDSDVFNFVDYLR